MKKHLFVIAFWIVSMFCLVNSAKGQSYVLDFDGIDDYIDVGVDAGDGIRTIELWFMPKTDIDSNLSEWSLLVYRDGGGNNIDVFYLAFVKFTSINAGQLRFWYSLNVSTYFTVHSDVNSWNANQWYHVAGVIHPQNGMSLYIDGAKQADTNAFFSATAINNGVTAIGRHEYAGERYFNGRIEDVRFSYDALYTSNFTPPCPDITAMPNSKTVWNFNEGSGTVAVDSSGYGYNGTIYGATYVMDSICTTTGIKENNDNPKINLYPNPTTGEFVINYNGVGSTTVYDILGNAIIQTDKKRIDISSLHSGIYYVSVKTEEGNYTKKVVLAR